MNYSNYDTDFGWSIGGMFKDAGNFVSNAVKTAGREIGKVDDHIQKVGGKVSKAISKVPVVGAPLHTVFDVAYTAVTGPATMTAQIAEGKRIDRVVMGHLKETTRNVKAVAPYAQSVVSLVPGIGPGVSAALGAGLALASGQPLDKIAEAAIAGAIPGGPLAVAAFHVASDGVKAAVTGEKFDVLGAATTAAQGGLQALGLPKEATTAISAGVDATAKLAKGEPLDKALTSAAVKALPINDTAKYALDDATDLTIALAKGQRVDRALLQRVEKAAKYLPLDKETKDLVTSAVKSGKSVVKGEPIEKTLQVALHGAIGDAILAHGVKSVPKEVRNALQTGLATGTAVVRQKAREVALDKVPGRLSETGIQISKALPVVQEARKLAKGSTRGFDLATGLMSHQINTFDIVHVRNRLHPNDRFGFDLGISTHTGLVANPMPKRVTAAARAGTAIAFGSAGMTNKSNRAAILRHIVNNPSAKVGVQLAGHSLAKRLQKNESNLIARIFYALGFR